jgi:RHS repeat-associated protein
VVDDQSALVAQYDYYPFGLQRSATGSAADAIPLRFMGQELDAVTGLYDFSARLYHPVLRRFCAPDSKRQFASPYVFVGNNPLGLTDPTGNVSVAGQVGIGVGMFALAAAGLALSIFTFGISDMVTGILETIGFGAEAGEAAGDAGGAVIEAGVEAGSEGGGQAAEDASLSTRAMNFARYLAPKADIMGGQIVSNTMFGIGSSGFQYVVTTPNSQWTGDGFRSAMISGTFSGILYGIGSGFLAQPAVDIWLKSLSALARVSFKVGVNAVMGLGTNWLAQVMTNAATHQPALQDSSTALIAGVIGGAIPFGMGDVLKGGTGDLVAAGRQAFDAVGDKLGEAADALAAARQAAVAGNPYAQVLATQFPPLPTGYGTFGA